MHLWQGNQWRLDAELTGWRPWVNLPGLASICRIEELGGCRDPAVYRLRTSGLVDLTGLIDDGNHGPLSPVNTLYGSTVLERKEEGHTFRMYRGQSGLLVRKEPGAPGGEWQPRSRLRSARSLPRPRGCGGVRWLRLRRP